MKLRYVGNHTFALYQKGRNVVAGMIEDMEPLLAAEMLGKYPKLWFEEKDPKGKVAYEKHVKELAERKAAKEAALEQENKMAVNAGKTK